jgi:hypothetical protein
MPCTADHAAYFGAAGPKGGAKSSGLSDGELDVRAPGHPEALPGGGNRIGVGRPGLDPGTLGLKVLCSSG